jgi:hypothetical protein
LTNFYLTPIFSKRIPLKTYVRENRTKKIEKRNDKMKKLIVIVGMVLCFCLIGGTAMADTFNQMGQPPMGGGQMQGQPTMGGPQMNGGQNGQMQEQPTMGGPQMNGGQNGQMQGQPSMGGPQMNGGQNGQMQNRPPMNLAVVDTDDETVISLFSETDSSSDVLDSVENGSVVEILEEDGDYTKVRINGSIGYVLSSTLAELTPEDGQEPSAKPEDGQEPPAKPEDGQEPPAKPEDGQEPPAKPEDGQEPPAKPEDDQQMSGQPVNGQMMPSQTQTDSALEHNEAMEPGVQSFFKTFMNFLTGKKAGN